ncbi:TonB-dependent receptor [Hyphomonas adhaerens MHS-3]|uniref:TonB-dependent receptor n=1 Tax=Hyphomonas adhaerens MHS-3 TaxID=1280949 RepID=A0A069E8A7_9PROT|nr:TonB-dependent receptor [Hyphomonas adhaerens]KCZ86199.1 TonB-dependent receptor [Hyphomonas adhaerens MHS-3]
MNLRLLASASAISISVLAAPAFAQDNATDNEAARATPEGEARQDKIIVTATRREQSLQDVPLAVTAFQQEAMSEKGIVSYDGLARETPGIVLNQPTANFNTITTRGIATNGYGANLQAATAIYINELPISSNGNSTILDPTLFDVERVEVLRGPQGTLFGANSLSGAVRILTKKPNPNKFEASTLVDFGVTDGDAVRQRYNGMVNMPLIKDQLALRVVGFYRDEDGWVDNLGTGIDGANSLKAVGGRAHLLWEPTSKFDVGLLIIREDNEPADSSLTNPDRGEFIRYTDRPDLFQSDLTSYNLTANWDMDFATLTTSSNYSKIDGKFIVDLAGTFAQTIPFALDAVGHDENFVQEVRLASADGGSWDWIVGGFYFNKRRDIDYDYRSSQEFLDTRGLTGLPDEYYYRYKGYFDAIESAAFGELTYHFSDKLWATGGLRYTETSVQAHTLAGGYNSNYLVAALYGLTNTALTITPVVGADGLKVEADNLSYKGSLSYKPVENLTTYASIATGFRSPVANARAGLASGVDPNDIIIPNGADSDELISYEVGMKGTFFDNKLTANLAAYYINWEDIQVQANRLSDQAQFATNIGKAVSQGLEFEIGYIPGNGFSLFANGSLSDTEITDLTDEEAAISGAEEGLQLAMPDFQGALTARYDFDIGDKDAFVTATAAYVGDFPAMLPNVPGNPGTPAPTFDYTEAYTVVNAQAGISKNDWKVVAYVENLFDDSSITYVHPEGFLDSRYARVRPQTVGVRVSYEY